MKKYLNREVLVPAAIIVFISAYIIEALTKLTAPMVDNVPQETFWPAIIAACGMVAAVILFISGIRKVSAPDYVAPERAAISYKPLYVTIATGIFIFLFDILGYTICAPLYVFAMMNIFDDKPQHFVKKAIYSIIITVLVYVLYNYIFDIRFPEIWR
jgi:putative tricarboxylic transport membrane protein